MKIKIKKPNQIGIKIHGKKVYPELENLVVTPSGEEQKFKSEAYGYNEVTVKAVQSEELVIEPKAEEQNFTGLFSSVKVNKITGEILEINPTLEKQHFKGIYSEVTVNEVTSNIDENIKAENIKVGVNILGVDGSYEGVDTSDATATPEDILKDKTAYVDNKKITGTIEEYNGSYSGEVVMLPTITNGYYLFYNGSRTEQMNELLSLCIGITNTSYMFRNCSSLAELDLSNLDTSNVTTMDSMFDSCSNLRELDVNNFNTRNVTNMNKMFSGCSNLRELDVNNFNTNNVTNMSYMFYNCSNLKELDVSNFNTSNVTDMISMFYNCSNLTELNLSNFDMSNVTNISNMFRYCSNLTNIQSFKNLGKAYNKATSDYSSYKLDLSSVRNLTYTSLIDIISNGLYDLNLTYDVANGGTLYRQSLVLDSIIKSKLSDTDIAIATNKGWDIK